MKSCLRLIEPVLKARIWGSRDLRAWYPAAGAGAEPVGEAWLSPPDCPVLIKLLFPRERLSVQVHPDDAYAAAHGLGCGKSEAWYVVTSDPDARLAAGLRPGVSLAEFEAACRAGHGETLLQWIPVAAGDVVDVPAGTVHAIGGGMVLLEVQQPSDVTFRLHDFGRGRTLHWSDGFAAAKEATASGRVLHGLAAGQSGCLLATPRFQMWRHCATPTLPLQIAPLAQPRWLVSLTAGGAIPKGWLAELPVGADFSQYFSQRSSQHTSQLGPATLIEIRGGMS